MKAAISKRPTQLCNNLASSVGLVADQWACGNCDGAEWYVYNSVKVDALVLQCMDCGIYHVLRSEGEHNEPTDIARAYAPGARGIYGGGD